MGKQKRAREGRQTEKDRKDKARKDTELKRRRFLKIAGGAGLVGAVSGGTWFLYDSLRDKRWDFIDRELFLSDDITADYARENFVPIGPVHILPSDSYFFSEAAELFKKEMWEKGYRGNFDIEINERWYGVPEKPEVAHNLAEYCRKAENFLHSRLNGLDKIKFDWIVLRKGENYEKNFNMKGFIGNVNYLVRDIKAHGEGLVVEGNHVKGTEGGRGRGNFDKIKKEITSYFMFIGAGTAAIQSPFSEIIPATVSRKTWENFEKLGYDDAWYIEEALAEGISYILSLEISKELNIPNGEKLMQELYDFHITRRQYKFLPQAIKWMQKNGIQKAYDLYMDSPLKFFEAIKKA